MLPTKTTTHLTLDSPMTEFLFIKMTFINRYSQEKIVFLMTDSKLNYNSIILMQCFHSFVVDFLINNCMLNSCFILKQLNEIILFP